MVPPAPPHFSRKESEKDLVAEQPGLGLSFIGLLLALFAGLAVRALVSPEKVRAHLEKATASVHKDMSISFKNAYVSFADGIFPDLSVVITEAKIESGRSCYLTPLAEVNEIRLPLSWWHLFQGKILIHELIADEVNLSLRSSYGACHDREVASESSVTSTNPSAEPKKTAEKEFESVQRKNPIDIVRFRSLKVHYLPKAFTSFEIQKFVVRLKAEEPRWVEVTGHLNLGGDTLVGDYSSHADLKMDAVEGEQPSVKMSLKGVWREGHYDVRAVADLKSQQFDLQTTLRHLPLSQLIPLLRKYRLMESDLNGKQAWISGDARMKGRLADIKRTPLHFENLKLEGDIGELSCAQAEIESFDPLKVKPVDFLVRGLNFRELLVFFNRPHPSPTLGALGIFNGTAHFNSPEDVVLRGDYSGLEFIFANQGVRKIQTLSLVSGELALNHQKWKISLDRIRPAEGLFEGKVQMTADRDFRQLEVNAKIEELSLSPEVQLLMTNGGSLGAVSGNLKGRIAKAELVDLQGNLKWDQLLVDGVHLNKPRVSVTTKNSEMRLDMAATDLDFSVKKSAVSEFLSSLISDLDLRDEERFLLKSPRWQIRTEKLSKLSWNDFQAQSSLGSVHSQGGWNEKADFFGEIKITGKKNIVWVVGGNRNTPVLRKQQDVR